MKRNPRACLGEALAALGAEDNRIYAVSCDSTNGGIAAFASRFPERFVECGIMEQTAVSVCAGLSHAGFIPFIATICPFLTMRAYEQIRDDIGFANSNVKLIGTGAGLGYNTLGQTHETLEDIAVMRTIANLAIYCPADSVEVQACAVEAARAHRPVYIRMPLQLTEDIDRGDIAFHPNQIQLLRHGADALLFATGVSVSEAVAASDQLEIHGIHVAVAEVCCINPLDTQSILALAAGYKTVFTVEEHGVVGGFGELVAATLARREATPRVEIFALPQTGKLVTGPYREVLDYYGLSGQQIAARIASIMKGTDIDI